MGRECGCVLHGVHYIGCITLDGALGFDNVQYETNKKISALVESMETTTKCNFYQFESSRLHALWRMWHLFLAVYLSGTNILTISRGSGLLDILPTFAPLEYLEIVVS